MQVCCLGQKVGVLGARICGLMESPENDTNHVIVLSTILGWKDRCGHGNWGGFRTCSPGRQFWNHGRSWWLKELGVSKRGTIQEERNSGRAQAGVPRRWGSCRLGLLSEGPVSGDWSGAVGGDLWVLLGNGHVLY